MPKCWMCQFAYSSNGMGLWNMILTGQERRFGLDEFPQSRNWSPGISRNPA